MIPSTAVFAACVAALIFTAWRAAREDPEATIAELFDRVMATRTVRIAMIVAWWWLGWHFFVAQTVDR
jgi:hypothetical protein